MEKSNKFIKIMRNSYVVGQKDEKMQKISIQFKTPFYRDRGAHAHQDDRLPLKGLQGMHRINYRTLARQITTIMGVENHPSLH